MFCIRIAGIPIGIDNRYPFVHHMCEEYETEEEPAFIVSVTDEEVLCEQNGDMRFSKAYCESLCIYRKICCMLTRYDAFLMHSAVVAVDDVSYVFAAPSGVGKTTHIQLWLKLFGKRARVINGDKPIFRFSQDVLYACGTPWKGKEQFGENLMRPVQAVCFLEQSSVNHIKLLDKSEVSKYIFSQLLIPKEQQEFDCFWKLLERMLASMSFYLLQCTPEMEAAQLAYETMRRK